VRPLPRIQSSAEPGRHSFACPRVREDDLVNLVHQKILFALHAGEAALGKRLVHDAVLKAQSHDATLRSRVSMECRSVALMDLVKAVKSYQAIFTNILDFASEFSPF